MTNRAQFGPGRRHPPARIDPFELLGALPGTEEREAVEPLLEELIAGVRWTRMPVEGPVTIVERTPFERAAWALSRACNGWRTNRTCLDPSGRPRRPHPGCLRAQEEHDRILYEAGLL